METVRIAAVTACSPAGALAYNLERTAFWAGEAARQGADMVCFPEMNLTGYDIRPEARKSALPIAGRVGDALRDLAARHGVVILAGLAEAGEDAALFASHVVVLPDGAPGVYRKLHIAPPEHPLYSPGADIPLFEARGVRFGIQLCYDAHFPVLSTFMAMAGADLIIMPHASPRGGSEEKYVSWMRHLPARAYDNSLFVLAVNQSGANGVGLSFPGLALALDPAGNPISINTDPGEGLTLFDLDGGLLARIRRNRMRFFLPRARADIHGRIWDMTRNKSNRELT